MKPALLFPALTVTSVVPVRLPTPFNSEMVHCHVKEESTEELAISSKASSQISATTLNVLFSFRKGGSESASNRSPRGLGATEKGILWTVGSEVSVG